MDAKTESAPKPADEVVQDQVGVAAERPVPGDPNAMPAPTIVDEAAAGVAGEAPPARPEREGDEGLAKTAPEVVDDKVQAEAKAQAEEKSRLARGMDMGEVDALASLAPPDVHPAVAELEGVAAQHGHRISIVNAEKSALPIYPVVIDKLNRLWRYEEGPDGEYLVMVGTARV